MYWIKAVKPHKDLFESIERPPLAGCFVLHANVTTPQGKTHQELGSSEQNATYLKAQINVYQCTFSLKCHEPPTITAWALKSCTLISPVPHISNCENKKHTKQITVINNSNWRFAGGHKLQHFDVTNRFLKVFYVNNTKKSYTKKQHNEHVFKLVTVVEIYNIKLLSYLSIFFTTLIQLWCGEARDSGHKAGSTLEETPVITEHDYTHTPTL